MFPFKYDALFLFFFPLYRKWKSFPQFFFLCCIPSPRCFFSHLSSIYTIVGIIEQIFFSGSQKIFEKLWNCVSMYLCVIDQQCKGIIWWTKQQNFKQKTKSHHCQASFSTISIENNENKIFIWFASSFKKTYFAERHSLYIFRRKRIAIFLLFLSIFISLSLRTRPSWIYESRNFNK